MLYSVFTYGTLQVPSILKAVTGVRMESEAAVLPGHACYRMQQRVYPGLIPCNNSQVRGRLYPGLDDTALEYLDAFEGVLYERHLLSVRTDNDTVPAQVYLIAGKYRKLLLPEAWDIEEFRARHLVRYLEYCRKFHDSYRSPAHNQ